MDRNINNEVASDDTAITNDSFDTFRKQENELDQLQLTIVGGGIADIIGI